MKLALKTRRAIDLKSKVAGQVTRLRVGEGDRVEAGQLLVEPDHREQALRGHGDPAGDRAGLPAAAGAIMEPCNACPEPWS